MILHVLEVWECRGITHCRLDLESSPVLIVGPNESGKSTLVDAFDLFLNTSVKPDGNSAIVKSLRPWNDDTAVPRVHAEFTVKGTRYTVRRSFASKTTIRKRAKEEGRDEKDFTARFDVVGNPSALRVGADADVALAELLAGVDVDLLHSLRITQKADGSQRTSMTHTSGASPLAEALDVAARSTRDDVDKTTESMSNDSAVTALAGDTDDEAGADLLALESLGARIAAEYSTYFTATGKDAAIVKNKRQAMEESAQALTDAQRIDADFATLRASLEGYGENITTLEEQCAKAQRRVDKAEKELEAAQQLRAAIERAEAQMASAIRERDTAASARESRQEDVRAIEEATAEVERLTEEDTTEADARYAAEARASALATQEAASEALRVATRAVTDATEAVHRAETTHRHAEITAVVDTAVNLTRRRDELLATKRSLRATPDLVNELHLAHNRAKIRRDSLLAGVPTMTITPTGETPIEVDGEPVTSSTEVSLARELTIRTSDAILVYRPTEHTQDLADAADNSEREVERRLHNMGVDTPEEADAIARRWQEITTEIETLDRDLAEIVGTRGLDEWRDELAALTAAVASVEEVDAGEPGGFGEPTESTSTGESVEARARAAERARSALVAAERARADAETARDAAASALEKATVTERDAERCVQEHQGKLTVLKARIADRAERLDNVRRIESDEELTARWEKATAAIDQHRADRDEATQRYEAQGGDHIQADLESAQAGLLSVTRRLDTLRQCYNETSGQLAHSLATVGEHHDLAQRESEAAVRRDDLRRTEKRAAAAKKLHMVWEHCRADMRARHQQPYLDLLNKLGKQIHGENFSVELAEDDSSIIARWVDGNRSEFDQLSGGAQEQLALMSRLASAALVARYPATSGTDGAVPIFLDDILGYSDPERRRECARMLRSLAADSQIIVLTCDQDRFAYLSGDPIYLDESFAEGGETTVPTAR